MPYFIKFTWESGLVNDLGPIAADNHKSVHGFEDRRIEKSCNRIVKNINKTSTDVICETVYLPIDKDSKAPIISR